MSKNCGPCCTVIFDSLRCLASFFGIPWGRHQSADTSRIQRHQWGAGKDGEIGWSQWWQVAKKWINDDDDDDDADDDDADDDDDDDVFSTVGGRNPKQPPFGCIKTLWILIYYINWLAGFLNHQQYPYLGQLFCSTRGGPRCSKQMIVMSVPNLQNGWLVLGPGLRIVSYFLGVFFPGCWRT